MIAVGLLLTVNCPALTHYVVTNGTPGVTSTAPYTNWETAGTNIIDVVNAAMTNTAARTVWVSNGTYYLTNQVRITNALTLQSVNGRNLTIVDGNYPNVTNRCFYINAAATLDGFTVSNGFVFCNGVSGGGGGIYVKGIYGVGNARIQNCRIVDNTVSNFMTGGWIAAQGGGIWQYSDAIVSNCDIIANKAIGLVCYAGGTYLSDRATIINSVIESNILVGGGAGGEAIGLGVYANSDSVVVNSCRISENGDGINGSYSVTLYNGSSVRNSLVCNNYGGIYIQGWGKVQNCTIASNRATGLKIDSAYPSTACVENVVCYLNSGSKSNFSYSASSSYTGSFSIVNSCIAPTSSLPIAAGRPLVYLSNNIEFDPQFVDKDTGNWRLNASSPCVNTGTNQSWMMNAVDLDNKIRIRYGTADMGAYETIYEGTIYRMGF